MRQPLYSRALVSYLTRTKLLGKCKVVRKGVALVIEGLTGTQRRLLDCVTWIVGPTDKDVDRARQLAGIPMGLLEG